MPSSKDRLPAPRGSRGRLTVATVFALAVVLAVALMALGRGPWNSPNSLDTFDIGYSAPSGQRLLVLRAEMNDGMRIPGGGVACCREEAGGSIGFHDQPMPYAAEITWSAEDTGAIYRARAELPDNLTARAARLPPAVREWDGRKTHSPHLIIGVTQHGAMTVWLSNAVQDYRFEGRVLEVITEVQGKRIEEHEVHP